MLIEDYTYKAILKDGTEIDVAILDVRCGQVASFDEPSVMKNYQEIYIKEKLNETN